MAQYDGSIRINTQINTKNASAQLMGLENRIVKTADKITSLRAKMDALRGAQIPTQEYQEIANQIAKAESEFNKLLEKQEQMQCEGKNNGVAWERLNARMEEVGNSIRYAQGELQDLVETGRAFTMGSETERYADLSQQLQYAENELETLTQRHSELEQRQNNNISKYKQLGSVAADALKKLGKSIYKYGIAPFISLGKMAAKTFLGIGKSAKASNNIFNKGLKNILKYGLGIRSLYALVNKLRTGIKEGFSNLYNDKNIAAFKKSVDSLKASTLTLKNSFAAAFRPIVEVAIPYIQLLIDYMIQLMNVAGQFMAAVTGQNKYTKAVKQTTEAIEAQNKAQNKQLSNLDNLNNLTSDKGAGSADTTGMFEEVPLEDKWKDIAQRLKEMWESSDFSDLGKNIGEWLKNALGSIPWNEIKKKARKVGESLATLINGFVAVPKLGYSIGKALSEAFNTAFHYLNGFVRKLKWKSLGKIIAETLNGLFENIEWDVIKDTFITGAKGLADLINSFADWFHWDNISDTISNGLNIITESIYTFFAETDFEELGQKLGGQLRKIIEKTDWKMLGRAIGSIIQAALDFVGGFISEQDFGEVAQAIFDVLKGIFETVDIGKLAEIIFSVLAIKIAAKATASAFETAAGAILSGLGSAISGMTGLGANLAKSVLGLLKTGLLITTQAFKDVGTIMLNGISGGLSTAGGIGGLLTSDIGALLSSGSLATIGITIGAAIMGGIMAAFAGWNFGQWLYEKITGEQIEMSFTEQVREIFKSFTDGSWIEAFKLWGHDIVEGLKQGIIDSFAISRWIKEHIFGPFMQNFKDLFKIHSPSTVMAEMGNYIVEGLLNGLKEKWKAVVDWITGKITWLNDRLSGITGKITPAFASGGNSGKASTFSTHSENMPYAANPAFAALGSVEIPKLATGAVIPANREFLAVLGDQKRGTNIEAPLSAIEEAVISAMAKVNGGIINSGGGTVKIEIPVIINGIGEIGRAVQQFDMEFFKQNGKHAFT